MVRIKIDFLLGKAGASLNFKIELYSVLGL
jgi:hypothetical protein